MDSKEGRLKRVKLKGGPEHTASSVEIKEDGNLVIEWYDFSPEAEQTFGNDVAYLLTVAAADKAKMLSLLREGQPESADAAEPDALLLRLMEARFESYFEVQTWLQANVVPYTKSFDSWA